MHSTLTREPGSPDPSAGHSISHNEGEATGPSRIRSGCEPPDQRVAPVGWAIDTQEGIPFPGSLREICWSRSRILLDAPAPSGARRLTPVDGQKVVFHYTAYNENGARIDSSYAARRPVEQIVGVGGMVPGCVWHPPPPPPGGAQSWRGWGGGAMVHGGGRRCFTP